MLKLLLFIGLLSAVYFVFFKKSSITPPSSSDNNPDEAMIPCAKCGTYVQAKEAFKRDGKSYCSRECMEG